MNNEVLRCLLKWEGLAYSKSDQEDYSDLCGKQSEHFVDQLKMNYQTTFDERIFLNFPDL